MLTVHTTEEFADWFGALGDSAAEEVATGIEVIAALGPERAPPASTSLLLWYECGIERGRLGRYGDGRMLPFAERAQRIVEHLGSPATLYKLSQVSQKRARLVYRSIAAIARRAWNSRLGRAAEADSQRLLDDYQSVLDELGLQEPAPQSSPREVRELSLPRSEPRMRLLYGVDAPNARALMILGEPLDRRAYGPSVRFALATWQAFLASQADMTVNVAERIQ